MLPGNKLTYQTDSSRVINKDEAFAVIIAGLEFALKSKDPISPDIFTKLCNIWQINKAELIITNLPKGRFRHPFKELCEKYPSDKPRITKQRLSKLLTAMLDTAKKPNVSLHTICEIIQTICRIESAPIEWQQVRSSEGRTVQEMMAGSRSGVSVKGASLSNKRKTFFGHSTNAKKKARVLTSKEFASLPSEEKEKALLDLTKKLRGKSAARKNCPFNTSAVLQGLRGSLPTRLHSAPAREKDYCLNMTLGKNFELNEMKFHVLHVKKATTTISDESKISELPLVQVGEKNSNGKKIPVLSFQEFEGHMSLYTNLDNDLINDAKVNGGTSKGWLTLFHIGKYVTESPHSVPYIATWDSKTSIGEVWYTECQRLVRGIPQAAPFVFNKITTGYDFIKSPDQPIEEFTRGPFVSWARDEGQDIIRVKAEPAAQEAKEPEPSPFTMAVVGEIPRAAPAPDLRPF